MTELPKGPRDRTYEHLIMLWTSGVRDYHSMLSGYLTANSIFVAVLGLLVSRESLPLPLMVLIVLLCLIGLLLCLQMAIVLGRFSGQNALWEWQLRGMERLPEWRNVRLLTTLHQLHETREPIKDSFNEPPLFLPNWAFRQHRAWWAHRAVSFPIFFGSVYAVFCFWVIAHLLKG